MATHFSILAWIIPWTEEPGGLQSIRSQSQTQLRDSNTHTHTPSGRWNDDVDPFDFNQQKLEFCRPRFSTEFSSAQAFS